MPSRVVDDVICKAGRTEEFAWTAYEADEETPIVLQAGDVVRWKLGITPDLDLRSNAATANGSSVIIDHLGVAGVSPARGRVRIAQGDSAGMTGKKPHELALVDDSEANPDDAIKTICVGYIVFWASAGGQVGLSS